MKYEIGKRICDYRKACGLSQKELANKIGVSNSRVSNWEQGINRPDADILVKLCEALNVSPSSLLGMAPAKDELSDQERKLLEAYSSKTDLQRAVNILLGLEANRP